MKRFVPFLALTGLFVLVALFLAGSAIPMAQAQSSTSWTEPFDDASQFVTSTSFFSDGGGDYFGLTNGTTGDFGGGAMPSALKPYSGFTGNFMTGMDLDGEGAGLPITVDWTSIDISAMASLEFSGDFAEYFDDPGDIDAPDYILIQYQIDGGGYQNLLQFSAADFTSDPYNGFFREDTDFDGLGDGLVLGNAAQTFTKSIAGSGSLLDLHMEVFVNSGDEDFGADNFVVKESGTVLPPEIVINEIMQNPNAVYDSAGEWFELFNPTASDIDIEGWTIKDDGSDSHVISNLGPLLVPAGGYAVLGINADSALNGGVTVDYEYSGITLANGADEVIVLDGTLTEIDRVEYDGGPAFPDPNGASMSLLDPALDNNVGVNWCTSTTPFGDGDKGTPGSLNNCAALPQEAFIHEVQGSGAAVAITDLVTVEAIVVGDFQDGDQLLGFFIQEEDDDVDGDPATSEGILAFCGGCTTDVAVGDKVQVTGWPGEYFDMSQIDAAGTDGLVTVVSSGNDLPLASTIDLPAADSTVAELTFEPVEGMLVTFPDTLIVSEYYELARFGQLVLTVDERSRQFTDANEPDVAGYDAFLNDLSTKRIILDDDNNLNNSALGSPDEAYYWPREGLSISNYIRGGDSIQNLTGVLHWSWAGGSNTNAWRVRPVLDVEAINYDFTPVLERPLVPEDVGGSFKVASFNVLNYFSTIDEGPDVCSPGGNMDCRGADSAAELVRQRDKIVDAMITMDADIIGLMELENNDTAAIQDLVDGLNAVAGPGAYNFIDTGTIGSDAIKQGFIYKTGTTSAVGDFAILDSSVDPTFIDTKNRPVLAQTFAETATGAKVTVAVNHLKSKGSSCDSLGDPDLGDGQANCNLTRTSAATALANWLAGDPTNSGDADFLIIGDLNSYRMEDPIDALKAGGYTDLMDALIGPDAYSYLFDGQLGYLDYAMANASLLGQVTGVTPWNINADEIPVFDYNDEILDSGEASYERESDASDIFESSAYRASDHDPVIVGLDLNGPPVCETAYPDPVELWPANHKYVPVSILGVTDPDGDQLTITVDAIFQDEPVNGTGDGYTMPDGGGIGTDMVMLRAERDGGGNGRAYHVYFTADDGQGHSCSGEVIVYVPTNQGKHGARIDEGPLYDSTIPVSRSNGSSGGKKK